jgi:purine-binding chemotaxis protein CheW
MTEKPRSAAPDAKEILRRRAQALARPRESAADAAHMLEVLEFRLAREAYAVETRHVVEVYPLKDLTPVPCTPAFITGIVNVRGRLTSVIDIKKFFGLPEKGLTDLHRVILVRGSDLEFGLLADVIVGVRNIAPESLQPALPTLTDVAAEYVKGVTAERLVVLDLARIVSDPGIVVHEEV